MTLAPCHLSNPSRENSGLRVSGEVGYSDSMFTPTYVIPDDRSAVALAMGIAAGRISRIWHQRGLGTIFTWLHSVPGLGDTSCRVEFMEGCFFESEVLEYFWGPTVIGGRAYEPELMSALRWVGALHPILIDCGANYGYWSIVATSKAMGFRHAIAIEANASTFERLVVNAHANGERFTCLHHAVGERSGVLLRLADARSHATAHVDDSGDGPEVETISIDDALDRTGLQGEERFVVKLDVEGYELPALEGAKRLRATKDHLFCVEDFAQHSDFATVRELLRLGYRVFFIKPDGRCLRIPDRESALRIATHPSKDPLRWLMARRGTGNARNFFACLPDSAFLPPFDAQVD